MTKTKITYVKTTLEEVEEETNRVLDALQVNTKVKIIEIKTEVSNGRCLVQIVYNIDEEPDPGILLESEEV